MTSHHHHKAASCSFIPSMHSLHSQSTISTQTESDQDSDIKPKSSTITRSDSNNSTCSNSLFPLPSFCLYSKSALLNEYAPESDIIQYLSPESTLLVERLPMFVGVLQSLVTVVNDLPFSLAEEQEEEEEEEEENEEEDIPFVIVGLDGIKLIVWKDMCDLVLDTGQLYKNDLCLVILVSSHLSDSMILKHMKLLEKSISHREPVSE